MGRWFAVAAALLAAILLHTFYVDYQVNAKRYLLSWPATGFQRSDFLHRIAKSNVRPPIGRYVLRPEGSVVAQGREHIEKYCQPTVAMNRLSRSAEVSQDPFRILAAYDPTLEAYWRCSKEFVPVLPEMVKVITPGVDYASALARAEKAFLSSPIRFGMVPSLVVAGDKPSRTSFVKSYWLGVIVPAALVLLAFFILAVAIRSRTTGAKIVPIDTSSSLPSDTEAAQRQVPDAGEILGVADAPEVTRPAQPTLADVLKSDLGNDFPVSGGNGKEDSPLVITATSDYVSVEYAVVRHMLNAIGEEYKLSQQALLNRDGRQIDMLVFDVKNAGAADWEGLRRFYFDITAGFGALR